MANVLVLDDEPDHLLLIRTWLEKMGHRVTTAQTAVEAFIALEGQQWVPDLAVLDVVMPQTNGVQFLQQLRKDPTYAKMTVIFLTAADLMARPEPDEAVRYVSKPLTRADLTEAVTAALSADLALNPGPESGRL